MGGRGSKTIYVDNPALLEQIRALNANNEALRIQFEKFMKDTDAQMEILRQEAMKEEIAYKLLERYLIDNPQEITFSDRIAMLGPKGLGKSTFLWLRGDAERPEPCLDDGTTFNHDEGIMSLDLIGTNMELEQLLKMVTVLLTKVMPDTFVLFSARAKRDALVLSHLMIRDFYVCPIVASIVHDCENPLDPNTDTTRFYDNNMTNLLCNAGYKTVTHRDAMPPLHGNRNAIDMLFPGGRIAIPTWAEFKDDPSSLNTVRFTIGKLYWKFKTKYNSNELLFMNAFDAAK